VRCTEAEKFAVGRLQFSVKREDRVRKNYFKASRLLEFLKETIYLKL